MHVCLVSQEFPPETGHGGIATQTRTKAVGLAGLGHRVTVVSHAVGDRSSDVRIDGYRLIRIPGPGGTTEAQRWRRYSEAVADVVDGLAPDVVEFPDYGAEGWSYVRLPRRAPVVVHLHGPIGMLAEHLGWPSPDDELARVGREMERSVIRRAEFVYASSRFTAAWASREYFGSERDLPVLHAGLDLDAFDPASDAPDRPTVLYAAKVGPSKGADVLVEAAARLRGAVPGLRVLVRGWPVADWPDRLLARFGGDWLEIAGPVDRAALPDLMRASSVLAVPSPFEGGPGFVYLEAMACGLPVIACSGSGVVDTVRHGATGLLVEPFDVDGVEAALRTVLGDPARAAAMGRRARSVVEACADARDLVPRIAALYETVLR